MATFDLGRVTPLYKGDYSASTSYELNDVVLYNGNLYWHVQATATVGIPPTDTTVWKLAFSDEGVRAEIRGYADNAQASADSASVSKSAAATSASQASASASQAALSAQTAQTAETGATASAQTASTKASEASASATSAEFSARTAIDRATLASQKAAAASESASIANEAKTAAINNAQLSVTKADEARNSATAAAASATSAQEYDESAQQSAVNAQTAQTAAETAQTAAETAQGLAEDARDEAQQIKDDVEDAIAGKADSAEIGDLSQLTTTAKDSLVSAVNETDGAITEINERLVDLETSLLTETEPSVSFKYTDGTLVNDIILNGPSTGIYDGTVLIDGVNVKVTSTNGNTDTQNKFFIPEAQLGNKANGYDNFVCDKLSVDITIVADEKLIGRTGSGGIELVLLKTRCEYTVESANAWLAQNPLRIWYKTTSHETAVQFYNIIKCLYTNNTFASVIGTLTPAAILAGGDKLSFATGKIYRVGGTEEQLSVSASVSDIPQNTVITSDCNISAKTVDIRNAISDLNDIVNLSKREYINGKFITVRGDEGNNTDYSATDYVLCGAESKIKLTGVYASPSSLAYAFYDETKQFISGQSDVIGDVVITEIPNGTRYARFGSRVSNGETPSCVVYNEKQLEVEIEQLRSDTSEIETSLVEPKDTTFFDGVNYFDSSKAMLYTDRFLSPDYLEVRTSSTSNTLVIPVKPNTEYYLYIPGANRYIVAVNESNDFALGNSITLLVDPVVSGYPQHFITGATTTKVAVYFYSGTYDYEANKSNIILNVGKYVESGIPYIPHEYLPGDISNVLNDTNVLIFGDSITDTCVFTINEDKETTALTWKNPSNSYVNAGGQTIRYNMWPKMLKDMGICAEVRNYARQGASFKDVTRPSGEERQNVSYQITVALNDLSNPHDVFDVDDFVPDIVIFALGTNDGAPNDTYDSAMAKTVLKSDGYSIDTSATLANLDMSKFCEAARSAFLRTRIAFPYAQFFCVLPIQRANNEVNGENLNTYLSKMAKRYGCIVIDGFAESGIVRDTNNWNALGETLKDGLHPNDKGQNMLFRAIYSSLISHYIVTSTMNP